MLGRFLVLLLVLPLLSGAALAASLPSVGERAVGTIDLLDKSVPLPPGEWRVAAAGFGQAGGDDAGPYGAIGGILLVRPHGDSGEFLLLHSNALPVRAGWGQPPECAADGVLFRSASEPRNLHNACSFVAVLRRAQLLRSRLPGIGDPNQPGLISTLPSWALIAGFRVSDRGDILDVRYGVAPREPVASSWFTADPMSDYAHRTVVKALGEWAQKARLSAAAALRDPAGQVPAMPALFLTDRMPEADVPREQISALRLSLYKLATYQVPSTALGLVVSSFVVGNIYTGAWISFWSILTHKLVFLGNELAWEWPSATPEAPLVGTPPVAPPGSARRDTAPDQSDPPIQLASNSAQLSALPIQHVFAMDGKQVPLPAGRWSILAGSVEGGISGVVLGQIDDAALRGLVVLHSNVQQTASISGPSSECGRSDTLFAVTRYDTPEDGFCAYGKRVMPMAPDERAMHENRLWARAAQELADNGVNVPPHLLMLGVRARTQTNFIDARYYFAPPADGSQATAALQDWAGLVQGPLELGVRGRGGAEIRRTPWPWDRAAVQQAIRAQSHEPLEELAAAGAIAPGVLAHQVAEADAAMADREQQRLSLWSRTLLKVATYRAASYVDTFAVLTLMTGNPAQGVAAASIHAVVKPLLAYGNEIYWAQSGIGRAPAALLAVNFPEIGADR